MVAVFGSLVACDVDEAEGLICGKEAPPDGSAKIRMTKCVCVTRKSPNAGTKFFYACFVCRR